MCKNGKLSYTEESSNRENSNNFKFFLKYEAGCYGTTGWTGRIAPAIRDVNYDW
jgi:hypothetical protein